MNSGYLPRERVRHSRSANVKVFEFDVKFEPFTLRGSSSEISVLLFFGGKGEEVKKKTNKRGSAVYPLSLTSEACSESGYPAAFPN